jgi:hypothetical protein
MITIRPATRQNTPLIIGLAGATKSGKTYSALRLATGLKGAGPGPIVMLNAEGPRGHLYADKFHYSSAELEPPYRPEQYIVAIERAIAVQPSVLIIDSLSHMHDGPGGVLHWHEEELDRMAGDDQKKRERSTFSAWIKPKAAVNQFIYRLLEVSVPVILCMRAQEKVRLRKGQEPEFYWGPIVTERIAFETIFTLIFPPHARGVPDLAISDLREPFDAMISDKLPVDEALGARLAAWAQGGSSNGKSAGTGPEMSAGAPPETGGSTPSPSTRTPFDDALDQINNVKTIAQRLALTERLKRDWGSFLAGEQKLLGEANKRMMERLGG